MKAYHTSAKEVAVVVSDLAIRPPWICTLFPFLCNYLMDPWSPFMKPRCLGLLLIIGSLASPSLAANPDWAQILGPAKTKHPAPQAKVDWRENRSIQFVLAEAQAANRPIFATFRCLPCKQCAGFDQAVLEGGPKLSPLLKQFITVRLTDANLLDERMFPYKGFQDLDLSWWGYLLSPTGQVYGVFGGKDHVSDATRISPEALANTLQRVLDHHYDTRRPGWKIDGPATSTAAKPTPPKSLKSWDSWSAKRPWIQKQTCVHCHQVAEVIRQPLIDAGTFKTPNDLYVWPLPENVGITLERDHGLKIKKIAPRSAASIAGLRVGDVLGAADGRRLFSQADFQGVLHRGPKSSGEVAIHWLRGGKVLHGKLRLKTGWRKTQMWWRKSVYDGNVGTSPGFFPLKGPKVGGRASIKPYMGKQSKDTPHYKAGLRPYHLITAIGGKPVSDNSRILLTWFRMNYKPGDTVEMTISHKGNQRKIRYRLPKKK
jgi:membrane-associated protease RseP (regulator of RpoE activity)